MNKTAIQQRRLMRLIESNRIVISADINSLMEKAFSMSPEERFSFVKGFVAEHGEDGTKSILNNLVSGITSKTSSGALYEGFNKKKEEPVKPSRLKQLLTSGEGWMVLLTFFLLLGAAGTSDYYSLVKKTPAFGEELKSFLLLTGSAFIAWAMNYIKNKIK